jgi:NADH dehydrogenase FAD-containing subunit
MLRSLNCHAYDVVLVSPRNHFGELISMFTCCTDTHTPTPVFTPLLASTAVGTLEFRCITEPIRSFANNVTYYEAKCDDVDFKAKKIRCVTTVPGSDKTRTYELSYDRLVLAVGSYAQTFNVPGVREHAFFFREVNDARSVRRRIIDCK